MSEKVFAVAIDGPAGAGKSTIAKELSKKLGVIYVDTGAMYRAMALFLIRQGIKSSETEEVTLNGENVNSLIRTEEVGNMASASSPNPDVRKKLVALQRKLASEKSVVMDGRDIGTVVLPNAKVKIYLTASSAVRAKRRYDELTAKGESCDIEKIEADIIERDHRDMTREISPLRQADDAVLVDTSDMSIAEVQERLLNICREKGCI